MSSFYMRIFVPRFINNDEAHQAICEDNE